MTMLTMTGFSAATAGMRVVSPSSSQSVARAPQQVVHILIAVQGRGAQPQPLGTAGDGGIVDGLDVDAVAAEQGVRQALQITGSPTSTGTMWLGLSISGNPADVRRRFSVRARS